MKTHKNVFIHNPTTFITCKPGNEKNYSDVAGKMTASIVMWCIMINNDQS